MKWLKSLAFCFPLFHFMIILEKKTKKKEIKLVSNHFNRNVSFLDYNIHIKPPSQH